jgi:hypothetical protein
MDSTDWFVRYLVCRKGPFEMLVIFTTTISVINKYRANSIVVIPFGSLHNLLQNVPYNCVSVLCRDITVGPPFAGGFQIIPDHTWILLLSAASYDKTRPKFGPPVFRKFPLRSL